MGYGNESEDVMFSDSLSLNLVEDTTEKVVYNTLEELSVDKPLYTLRPYQVDAVSSTLTHLEEDGVPSILVLPTGSGKSLIIAELAHRIDGRVLVLVDSKELVKQNHEKYELLTRKNASIYCAGLNRKDDHHDVVFASIKTAVNSLDVITNPFKLVLIDECHSVGDDYSSQYNQMIRLLQSANRDVQFVGLTATPYRLKMGWLYQYHVDGTFRTEDTRFFRECIYEVSLKYLLSKGYIAPIRKENVPTISYDFSKINPAVGGYYRGRDLNMVIDASKRITPQITEHLIQRSENRCGVLIYASTVEHAKEIYRLLPKHESAIIVSDVDVSHDRDSTIERFRNRKLKYIVNVGILTKGFDVSHVDVVAVMRPTESVSLYQQIVGRGMRLDDGKDDCLLLDYAGNDYDIFDPEIGEKKPESDSVMVDVNCPKCDFTNKFWGKVRDDGTLIKHYGRRCQHRLESGERCDYFFESKPCPHCGAENDKSARKCHNCGKGLIDPDDKMKEVLGNKDVVSFECRGMVFNTRNFSDGHKELKITYIGMEYQEVFECYPLDTEYDRNRFIDDFEMRHLKDDRPSLADLTIRKIEQKSYYYRRPEYVIAEVVGDRWVMREKIFLGELVDPSVVHP